VVLLVAAGAEWKYHDFGQDLGIEWRARGYDDSLWRSGHAQLGYGDGDETTVLSYGPDGNHKYPTSYFRHTFSVGDVAAVGQLSLRLVRDDGAVIYINGVEVARSNMPSGEVFYDTWADEVVGGASESAWYDYNVEGMATGTCEVAARHAELTGQPMSVNVHQPTPGFDAGGPIGEHVFRAELLDGRGRPCPETGASFLAPRGLCTASIKVPRVLRGALTLRVRDVATGTAAETKVR